MNLFFLKASALGAPGLIVLTSEDIEKIKNWVAQNRPTLIKTTEISWKTDLFEFWIEEGSLTII